MNTRSQGWALGGLSKPSPLSDEGFVENSGTSPARYRVSEKGWSVLGEPVASQLGVHHPPATPPPLGGGVERREEERQTVI
jgi:hypothetical protein